MPTRVRTPSLASIQPEVGLNQPSSGSVAAASASGALANLTDQLTNSMAQKQQLMSLADGLEKSSPEAAATLRASAAAIPLFGGGGSGGSGGGGGVSGIGRDAVQFALNSAMQTQRTQDRLTIENQAHQNSMSRIGYSGQVAQGSAWARAAAEKSVYDHRDYLEYGSDAAQRRYNDQLFLKEQELGIRAGELEATNENRRLGWAELGLLPQEDGSFTGPSAALFGQPVAPGEAASNGATFNVPGEKRKLGKFETDTFTGPLFKEHYLSADLGSERRKIESNFAGWREREGDPLFPPLPSINEPERLADYEADILLSNPEVRKDLQDAGVPDANINTESFRLLPQAAKDALYDQYGKASFEEILAEATARRHLRAAEVIQALDEDSYIKGPGVTGGKPHPGVDPYTHSPEMEIEAAVNQLRRNTEEARQRNDEQ